MATIISNEGSIILNGSNSIPKGLILVSISSGLVIVRSSGGNTEWRLKNDDTTVDGESFASAEELLAKISSFKRGGGNGSGVAGLTWDDTSIMPVAGKVPAFSEQGLLSTGMPLFPENAVPLAYVDLILQRFIGVFDSEEALNTAHPTGAESQYAYVRDIDSTGDIFRYYYWNDMAEAWLPLNKGEDDIYRSTEGLTNKIWVNGKKVYRYVFYNVQVEDDSEIVISLAGLGITEITYFDYLIKEQDRMHKDTGKLYISVTNTSLSMSPSTTPAVPTSVTVTLEYTK